MQRSPSVVQGRRSVSVERLAFLEAASLVLPVPSALSPSSIANSSVKRNSVCYIDE